MSLEPTVFIVDDDQAVCDQLSFTVKSVGLEAKTYLSAEDYLSDFDAAAPGCLVLDIRLAGMSGLDLQRRLAAMEQSPPVVMITGHGDIPMAIEAIRGGVVDFLEKPFREQELLDAIRAAIERDDRARREREGAADLRCRLASLTPRQKEILRLLADGKSNKAIGATFSISHKTVETHRTRIMAKLEVANVAELISLVLSNQAVFDQIRSR